MHSRLTAIAAFVAWLLPAIGAAQDLTPRAYVAAPVTSSAIILTYAFSDGELVFDPTVPIEDAAGTIHTPVVTYFHQFDFFGHSANVSGSLPFASGSFSGTVSGTERSVHRGGLADPAVRFAVNLLGGRALTPAEFVKTPPPRATLGASVKVIAPAGQYNPAFLINIGSNRWGLKPELGYTRRVKAVTLDMYAGVWFFTTNDEFFTPIAGGPLSVKKQRPIGAFESHVSYDFKPRLWISADINYWRGGRTTVNDITNTQSLQANSRFGVTGSVPLTRHQAVKVSYSD